MVGLCKDATNRLLVEKSDLATRDEAIRMASLLL